MISNIRIDLFHVALAFALAVSVLLNLWQWRETSVRSEKAKVVAMQLEKAAIDLAGKLNARVVTQTRTIERTRNVIVSEVKADPELQDPISPALDAALRSADERMRANSNAND